MRLSLIACAFIFIPAVAIGQLTKGNWLVGGNGGYSSISNSVGKTNYLDLSPNIGYFLSDKFAAGLKVRFNYSKLKANGSDIFSKKTAINFGPFARYYFLKVDKPFNILAEAAYQHGLESGGTTYSSTKYTLNTYSFFSGPVIFFNSTVGLEFLLGYTISKYTASPSEKRFQVAIGLQVHLEK